MLYPASCLFFTVSQVFAVGDCYCAERSDVVCVEVDLKPEYHHHSYCEGKTVCVIYSWLQGLSFPWASKMSFVEHSNMLYHLLRCASDIHGLCAISFDLPCFFIEVFSLSFDVLNLFRFVHQ